MAHCLSWRPANVFRKWALEIILSTNAFGEYEDEDQIYNSRRSDDGVL
jgi:hypothetical protein